MTNDEILQVLAQIESNGGKNFNHPLISRGPDAGTHAIGNYGLTAATVDDTVKNDPNLVGLTQLNPVQKKWYLESNPDIEHNVASQLIDRLAGKYNNDPQKIAYAWNHGTYIDPNKITPEKLKNDDYTNKFNKLSQNLSNNSAPQANNMPKSEDNSQKSTENLPTVGISLNDLINDPNNLFKGMFGEDEDNKF